MSDSLAFPKPFIWIDSCLDHLSIFLFHIRNLRHFLFHQLSNVISLIEVLLHIQEISSSIQIILSSPSIFLSVILRHYRLLKLEL
jgi:hypothetical protein